jgi:hypothetical protein
MDRLGGVTMRDLSPAPALPVLAFSSAPPVINVAFLAASSPVQSYDVKIVDPDDRREVLHVPSGLTKISLDSHSMINYLVPGGHTVQFESGRRYVVDITAYHKSGPQTGATYAIQMDSSEKRKVLQDAVQAANREVESQPDDATPFALVAALFEAGNSYQDALSTLQGLALHDEAHAEYLHQLVDGLTHDLEETNRQAEAAHAAQH